MSRLRIDILGLAAALAGALAPAALAEPATPPVEHAVHLVFFAEPALAAHPGLGRAPGGRLDARSPASRAFLAWLERGQDEHLDRIAAALGRRPDVVFRYRAAGNGVALRLDAGEAERLRRLPGVVEVLADTAAPVDTDRGPALIGAPAVWNGAALGTPVQGEGVIVGVIDTGVNLSHPSFSDAPVDGHAFTNPFGAGSFVGFCDPGNPSFDPAFVCNDKLIGAWDFVDSISPDEDGPEDSHGHGSHTASTAAGNHLDYNGDGVGDMSGVAPHANLITYDACYVDPGTGQGLCPFSSTVAAVDRAILDGVDVINYSISTGVSPWSFGEIDRFFLDAVGAGIFVSASAGNSGPGSGTVAHLGPWVTTVAASTMDRVNVQNQLVELTGGATGPPPSQPGLSRTGGYGPAPIVYAGGFANGDPNPEQCLSPFPPGTWSGQIVLCDRGGIPRVMKGQNVLAGGAGGMVLANPPGQPDTPLSDDAHILPAIHVNLASGDALRSWLATGSGHMARITPGTMVLSPSFMEHVASFSSRGPNPSFDVLKPNVTNPGVNVFAAFRAGFLDEPGLPPFEGLEVTFLSGTSMSSPHTAGCAALVRSAHPTWTPAQVGSALMTTAMTAVLDQAAAGTATPFARGGGRVRPAEAVRAGLLLDETQANFLAANPATGGDPRTLNLGSLTHGACPAFCSWTRTVLSALGTPVTWTASASGSGMTLDVQPVAFTLAPGASQELTITANPAGAPAGVWAFGEVRLRPDDAAVAEAGLPVAIVPLGDPDLAFENYEYSDGSLGNGDGVVDPFEIITLMVDLRNAGGVASGPIAGVLSTTTPGVSIRDEAATWQPIPSGLVGTTDPPHFLVEVGGSVPCGAAIAFHLDASTLGLSFPLDFDVPVGFPPGAGAVCSPVPCKIAASASASPPSLCAGEATVISAAGSLSAGSDCSGTLQYRFERDGALLQDWSADLDLAVVPAGSTAYAVWVRDPGPLAQSLAYAPVEVFPIPVPAVTQTPPAQCTEIGSVQLDAGPGFASYAWRSQSGDLLGTGQVLATTCAQGTVDLTVTNEGGCAGALSFPIDCAVCTPPEVSAAGSPAPLLMGLDAAGTVEFERLADPTVVYHLYNAATISAMLAGDWTYKLCDLEHGTTGTWTPVDATRVRFTPVVPGLIFPGFWVVVAESAQGFVGPFGFGSSGAPRPPDADGLGSLGTFGCP